VYAATTKAIARRLSPLKRPRNPVPAAMIGLAKISNARLALDVAQP
jgi:hypothetical protein